MMENYLAENAYWNAFINVSFSLGLVIVSMIWQSRGSTEQSYEYRNPSQKFFWPVLWALAIAARIPLLFDFAWYDETFSYAMTRPSWGSFGTALMSDVHPPLHYIILRLLSGLDSILVLRLPSFVAGLALIWIVYRLTLGIAGSLRDARLAAIITAFMPAAIYYSTEARYPMLLAVAICGGFLAIVSGKQKAFIFCVVATAYLHNIGIIYAFALMFIAWKIQGQKWRLPIGLSLCLSALWIPFILLQSQDVSNGFWLPELSPFTHLVDMTLGRYGKSLETIFITSIIAMASCIFAALYMGKLPYRSELGLLAIGLPFLIFAIGLVWKPVYLPRAFLGSIALLIPSFAMFVNRISRKWRIALLSCLLGAAISSSIGLYQTDRASREAALFEQCAGADAVFTTSTSIAIMARYYLDTPIFTWEKSNNQHQELSHDALEAMGIRVISDVGQIGGNICFPARLDYFTSLDEINFWESIKLLSPEIIYLPNQHHLYTLFVFWLR